MISQTARGAQMLSVMLAAAFLARQAWGALADRIGELDTVTPTFASGVVEMPDIATDSAAGTSCPGSPLSPWASVKVRFNGVPADLQFTTTSSGRVPVVAPGVDRSTACAGSSTSAASLAVQGRCGRRIFSSTVYRSITAGLSLNENSTLPPNAGTSASSRTAPPPSPSPEPGSRPA